MQQINIICLRIRPQFPWCVHTESTKWNKSIYLQSLIKHALKERQSGKFRGNSVIIHDCVAMSNKFTDHYKCHHANVIHRKHLIDRVHQPELNTTMKCNQLLAFDWNRIDRWVVSTQQFSCFSVFVCVFELGLNENKLIQALWQYWSYRHERRLYYIHTNTIRNPSRFQYKPLAFYTRIQYTSTLDAH